MTVLSVNINKIATLRNSRGKDSPSVLKTALFLQRLGAQGITVHPRPDERHIRKQDVVDLKNNLAVELNVEGYPSSDFLKLVALVQPAQVTLVPDPPEALTSNAGWRWSGNAAILTEASAQLLKSDIRVSLFMDPFNYEPGELKRIREIGVQRLELYTEKYALDFGTDQQERTLEGYRKFSDEALALGFGLNAGHDLNARNVRGLLTKIPEILEVSIGHAFITDALKWGLETTLKEYQRAVDLTVVFEPLDSGL